MGSSKKRFAPGRRQNWELRTTTAEAASSLTWHSLAASEQDWVGDRDRIQNQGSSREREQEQEEACRHG